MAAQCVRLKAVKMEGLVSVIVPVYNVKKYLKRCVDSILQQSYQTFELILVDDGSTDGSYELCDEFAATDSRIKVMHKKNTGVSAARNDGIDLSEGTYLAFIDGDDWVEVDYLKRLVKAIVDNEADEAAVGFKYVYENGNSKLSPICDSMDVLSNMEALDQAMDPVRPWVGFAWGKLVKSSKIKKNSIKYDSCISLCEDSLFNYTVLQHVNKVVKIPDILYNYYIRNTSATRMASSNYKSLRSKIDAFTKAAEIAENFGRGGQFQTRVNNALFDAIVSYLAAMFSSVVYDKNVVHDMKMRLKSARPFVNLKNLTIGIRVRYILFKLNPRLLYFMEVIRK